MTYRHIEPNGCGEGGLNALSLRIPERESSRRDESRAEEAILRDDFNTCANLSNNHRS
jgi:hypothetical protein